MQHHYFPLQWSSKMQPKSGRYWCSTDSTVRAFPQEQWLDWEVSRPAHRSQACFLSSHECEDWNVGEDALLQQAWRYNERRPAAQWAVLPRRWKNHHFDEGPWERIFRTQSNCRDWSQDREVIVLRTGRQMRKADDASAQSWYLFLPKCLQIYTKSSIKPSPISESPCDYKRRRARGNKEKEKGGIECI